MTLIIIWAIALVGIVYFNARFWGIMPDLEDSEEKEAKARNIAPVMPQTPIPMKHKIAYVRDWIILVAVISVVVWLICNAI